ncbi:MAG: hypothetical protein AVDCRST_MAG79-1197, partial [uncultured Thermoleophilia bacterium]
ASVLERRSRPSRRHHARYHRRSDAAPVRAIPRPRHVRLRSSRPAPAL